jgi:hypothetical protein
MVKRLARAATGQVGLWLPARRCSRLLLEVVWLLETWAVGDD